MVTRKASNKKKDRQRERKLKARIRAGAAESRGRRVGSTVTDYEAALVKGDRRVAEALISRHNVRMENIPKTFDDYRFAVMSALVPVVHLDLALNALGANARRPPPLHAGPVPDLLAWGVDSAVSAARLFLSGQVLGATIMIRNQLERWVSQRAADLKLKQHSGESTLDFIARTWSHPDPLHSQWYDKHVEVVTELLDADDDVAPDFEQSVEHLHVYRSDGSEVCPAFTYRLLSEFIHMRSLGGVPYWDAKLLVQDESLREEVLIAASVVCDAIFLALREIRLSALKLAKRRGLASTVDLLSSGMDAISMSEKHTDLDFEAIPIGSGRTNETLIPPVPALAPLTPQEGLSSSMVGVVDRLSADYGAVLQKLRPAGRLYRDDELAVRAFSWHRRRSITLAVQALNHERTKLGADFNLESISGRSTRWVILTEAAGMLSVWHDALGVKVAASALSSTLRSAYWLWLEDDDRAMAILRSSLEYVACLRTWRRKPEKAASLQGRPATTPRDWITQAGWKRLYLLNQALGEFAHARKMSQWPAARQLLSEFQLNVEVDEAIYTARGAAIDFTASLAAREAVLLLSQVSVDVADAVGRVFQELDFELDEDAFDVEAQFAHIWAVRSRRHGN